MVLIPLLLAGFIALFVVLYATYSIILRVLIWWFWCSRGRDILFVYSDSPIWSDYIKQRLLIHVSGRAVVLNWSERKRWRTTLATLAFRHFGGNREFNPLAVVFRPFGRTHVFRFWKAFQDRKHGRPDRLQQLERNFFETIGATTKVPDREST